MTTHHNLARASVSACGRSGRSAWLRSPILVALVASFLVEAGSAASAGLPQDPTAGPAGPRSPETQAPGPEATPQDPKKPAKQDPQNPGSGPQSASGTQSGGGTPREASSERGAVGLQEQAEVFAQVESGGAVLRAYADLGVPAFPTVTGQGDVLWIAGPAEGEFLPVRVPGGVLGYVHERFATIGDDGSVTLERDGVAFRHEPKAGVVPVAKIDQGEELWIVSREDGGWLLVRQPNRVVHIPIRSVTRHASDATLQAAADDLEKRNAQRTEDFVRAVEERRELAALRARHLEEVQELETAVKTEAAKPTIEQDWQPLASSIAAFIDSTDPAEPARPLAEQLSRAVELRAQQAEIDRAVLASGEERQRKRERANEVLERIRRRENPFQDYESGILRLEDPLLGEPTFWLEKGDQKLFRLTCSTGRYVLEDFVDRQVLVRRGRVAIPAGESRTIDLTSARAILILGQR